MRVLGVALVVIAGPAWAGAPLPRVISPQAFSAPVALQPMPPPEAAATPRAEYLMLIAQEAVRAGVPMALADAVATVESGYNPLARGTSGEVGLMQILPTTAAQLGFSGNFYDLSVPATNIHYGVAYLARAWAASGGSVCRALMKYRAGLAQDGFSPLSITYCSRASAYLAGEGIDLEAAAPAVPAPAPAFARAGVDDPYVMQVMPRVREESALFAQSLPKPRHAPRKSQARS